MIKKSRAIFALAAILLIFFLMEPIAESVCSQSTKPSAPQFTIKVISEDNLQLVIENQHFTSSSSVNAIEYYYRVKDHYSQQWMRNGGDGQLQSDSKTTLIEIKTPYPSDYPFDPSLQTFLNNSTVLDFQVQAKTGYYLVTQKPGYMPGIPPVGPGNGYTEITFNESETSDWSNTQTITLSANVPLNPSPSPNTSASPTPSVPELSWLAIVPLLLSLFSVAVILRNRKTFDQ
jgi:hypothetical protein